MKHADQGATVIGDDLSVIWRTFTLEQLAILLLQHIEQQAKGKPQHKDTNKKGSTTQKQKEVDDSTSKPPHQEHKDASQATASVTHEESDVFVKRLMEKGWDEAALSISTHMEHSTTAYIIDTGGQPEFHAILPLLLRGPAMYLLLFNLAESLDECYNVKYATADGVTLCGSSTYTSSYSTLHTLSQLLNSFTYNNRVVEKGDIEPIAILLATHLDLVSQKNIDLEEVDRKLREAFKSEVKMISLLHDASTGRV